MYDYEKCTNKGKNTIDILGWGDIQFLIMHQDTQDKKGKPIRVDLKELIEEIVAYK